ncbi:uncharacterized protein LOC119669203 [Teleopsis dalmanni]|uniref:uncharacterized protein LOC119669203 n=1 Tax=Teleopsis dalmanni TaxID=139649 RepID=UPI0018CE769C|nr:uncharacterized protein LOC119669203 [Teleopsis dalmanni]XP_037934949.1 uncharacterized protein LOC119669203 [Teleopsis dalmanni]XP_037934950.1 uncharacterized protein LOC119669203 [Teleopsis dalmanni]XP_037934951.1 uncharacterized protein LOC119669203 [Teleopsis dalmanni]XP_037934952.1 uncharacterized protein LOC119669203 [Teleopsis dalmanni]
MDENSDSFLYRFFFDVNREPNVIDYVFRSICIIIILLVIKKMLSVKMDEPNFVKERQNLNRQKASLQVTAEAIRTLYMMRGMQDNRFKRKENENLENSTYDPKSERNTNIFQNKRKSSTSVIGEEDLDGNETGFVITKNIPLNETNKAAVRSMNIIGKKVDKFKVITPRDVVSLDVEEMPGIKSQFKASGPEPMINASKSSSRASVKSQCGETKSTSSYLLKDSDSMKSMNRSISSASLKSNFGNRCSKDDTSLNSAKFDGMSSVSSQLTLGGKTKSSLYYSTKSNASLRNTTEHYLSSPSKNNLNLSKHSLGSHQKLPELKKSQSSLTLSSYMQNNDSSPRSRINTSAVSCADQSKAELMSTPPRKFVRPASRIPTLSKVENIRKTPLSSAGRTPPRKVTTKQNINKGPSKGRK